MPKAIWKNAILAQSDRCEVMDDNYYFPPDSINQEYFKSSETHTSCALKGQANYFTIVVNEEENQDAAWVYPNPQEEARNIKGYVAFWRGVKVID
ncbi:MAG: DUF427 domain-containing protein [Prochloraceae cyanobacterium]